MKKPFVYFSQIKKFSITNRQTWQWWIVGYFVLMFSIDAGTARGQSFTVDPNSVGLPGTGLANEPPPSPNDTFNALGFTGTNILDDDNAFLGFPQEAPPDINALSAGFEPLDEDLWDILFSVQRDSVGVAGSSVNFRAGQNSADIFFTNPSLIGTNRLLAPAESLGLSASNDEIDGMEVFDSRDGFEDPYDGFANNGDNVYLSDTGNGGGADNSIQIAPRIGGGAEPLFSGVDLGLVDNDNIDALALDIGFENEGNGDGKIEALFSLAPSSPTLNTFVPELDRNLSPADILYTDFSGNFDIAGTGILGNFENNIEFFDLTAENLGLLPANDNVDAIDIVFSSTSLAIPQDPDFPVNIPVVPQGQGDFFFVPPGVQLDDDRILDILLEPEEPISFDVFLDATGLVLNPRFTELRGTFNFAFDPGELQFINDVISPAIPGALNLIDIVDFIGNNPGIAPHDGFFDFGITLESVIALDPKNNLQQDITQFFPIPNRDGFDNPGMEFNQVVEVQRRESVPEPSSIFGLLALGTLGVGSTLIRARSNKAITRGNLA